MQKTTTIVIIVLALVILGFVAWSFTRPATTVDTSLTEKDWDENAPATVTLDPATLDSEIMVHSESSGEHANMEMN